jgi:transcriptional regulator with XRE-family HTH domain
MTNATEQSPAMGRRRLRAELRRARDFAGMTQEQVSREMDWSLSKLIRIETGAVGVSTVDMKALLRLYGIDDPPRVKELTRLARASRRRPDWWAGYRDLISDSYRKYIEFEKAATRIRSWRPHLVPGLLQTEEYARAIVAHGGLNRPTERDIDRWVEIRMIRQRELFEHEPPQIVALLGEAVVRQVVGGPKIMRAQLSSLIERVGPDVDVRVVPFGAGTHPGLSGGFAIMEFQDELDLDVVYLETARNDMIDVERPSSVNRYEQAFQTIGELALSQADTTSLLSKLIKELT